MFKNGAELRLGANCGIMPHISALGVYRTDLRPGYCLDERYVQKFYSMTERLQVANFLHMWANFLAATWPEELQKIRN